jgi:hypothetical protein
LLAPLAGDDAAARDVVVAARSWTAAPLFVVQADRPPPASQLSPTLWLRRSSAEVSVNDLTRLAPQSTGLFVAVALRNVPP